VAPTFDSVEGGTYKLSRPLFIYSTAQIMAEKPQVDAFVNYYLANVQEVVGKVGYFPVSEFALNRQKTWYVIANAMGAMKK
jgi:ABC-type phosphate transport system substrate-binding protein